MKASFQQHGMNGLELILKPDTDDEALLLASWLQYDANPIYAGVERFENGHIQVMRLKASDAR